jgi:fluoride ion exporter CrcB/FEX
MWFSTINIPAFGEVKMGATQTADARFLRRILLTLVMLTLVTGAIAAYTTVSAMSSEGVNLCATTGLLCTN